MRVRIYTCNSATATNEDPDALLPKREREREIERARNLQDIAPCGSTKCIKTNQVPPPLKSQILHQKNMELLLVFPGCWHSAFVHLV